MILKINDLVLPKKEWGCTHIDYGVGIVIDTESYDDEGTYCLVKWPHEDQWWNVSQLIKVKESDEKNHA